MTLLVIAGAGASYDAFPYVPGYSVAEGYRFPLADELFNTSIQYLDIQRSYPAILPIWNRLHDRRGQPVEQILNTFQEETRHNRDRFSQLVAVRYYIQDLIWQCDTRYAQDAAIPSNMMTLLDQIEAARCREPGRAQAAFLTFNYDCLIEGALTNRGHNFPDMDSYIRPNRPKLFKLHGSRNWVRPAFNLPMDPADMSRREVCRTFGMQFHELSDANFGAIQKIRSLNATNAQVHSDGGPTNHVALPAIAIPITQKDKFECPDSHVEALKTVLAEVRCVVTIGWRGMEDKFLRMLREHATRRIQGICISGDKGRATEVANRLQGVFTQAHFTPYEYGFSEFANSNGIDRLLNLAWQ